MLRRVCACPLSSLSSFLIAFRNLLVCLRDHDKKLVLDGYNHVGVDRVMGNVSSAFKGLEYSHNIIRLVNA